MTLSGILIGQARQFGDSHKTSWEVAYAILELTNEDGDKAHEFWVDPTSGQISVIVARAKEVHAMYARSLGEDPSEIYVLYWGEETV